MNALSNHSHSFANLSLSISEHLMTKQSVNREIAVLSAGGAAEISLWRQPPGTSSQWFPAPAGATDQSLNFYCLTTLLRPCQGANIWPLQSRWLAPPANFHCPFGAERRFR